MRTVVAYENGRKVWSENVPAATGSSLIRGALVVAPSAPRRERKPPVGVVTRPLRPGGRPRLSPDDVPTGGRGRGYPSEELRVAARRQSWRETKRRQHA